MEYRIELARVLLLFSIVTSIATITAEAVTRSLKVSNNGEHDHYNLGTDSAFTSISHITCKVGGVDYTGSDCFQGAVSALNSGETIALHDGGNNATITVRVLPADILLDIEQLDGATYHINVHGPTGAGASSHYASSTNVKLDVDSEDDVLVTYYLNSVSDDLHVMLTNAKLRSQQNSYFRNLEWTGMISLRVYTGSGDDIVTVFSNTPEILDELEINTGSGRDNVTVNSLLTSSSMAEIETDHGEDNVMVNKIQSGLSIHGGDGDDSIIMHKISTTDVVSVNGGGGDDEIAVEESIAGTVLFVSGGCGNDLILLGGTDVDGQIGTMAAVRGELYVDGDENSWNGAQWKKRGGHRKHKAANHDEKADKKTERLLTDDDWLYVIDANCEKVQKGARVSHGELHLNTGHSVAYTNIDKITVFMCNTLFNSDTTTPLTTLTVDTGHEWEYDRDLIETTAASILELFGSGLSTKPNHFIVKSVAEETHVEIRLTSINDVVEVPQSQEMMGSMTVDVKYAIGASVKIIDTQEIEERSEAYVLHSEITDTLIWGMFGEIYDTSTTMTLVGVNDTTTALISVKLIDSESVQHDVIIRAAAAETTVTTGRRPDNVRILSVASGAVLKTQTFGGADVQTVGGANEGFSQILGQLELGFGGSTNDKLVVADTGRNSTQQKRSGPPNQVQVSFEYKSGEDVVALGNRAVGSPEIRSLRGMELVEFYGSNGFKYTVVIDNFHAREALMQGANGNDTFHVARSENIDVLDIRGASGADSVYVGLWQSKGSAMQVHGEITVDGGQDGDNLRIDDSLGRTEANVITYTSTINGSLIHEIIGSRTAEDYVQYANVERIEVLLATGKDLNEDAGAGTILHSMAIEATVAGGDIYVTGGVSDDLFVVNSSQSLVHIEGMQGDDFLFVPYGENIHGDMEFVGGVDEDFDEWDIVNSDSGRGPIEMTPTEVRGMFGGANWKAIYHSDNDVVEIMTIELQGNVADLVLINNSAALWTVLSTNGNRDNITLDTGLGQAYPVYYSFEGGRASDWISVIRTDVSGTVTSPITIEIGGSVGNNTYLFGSTIDNIHVVAYGSTGNDKFVIRGGSNSDFHEFHGEENKDTVCFGGDCATFGGSPTGDSSSRNLDAFNGVTATFVPGSGMNNKVFIDAKHDADPMEMSLSGNQLLVPATSPRLTVTLNTTLDEGASGTNDLRVWLRDCTCGDASSGSIFRLDTIPLWDIVVVNTDASCNAVVNTPSWSGLKYRNSGTTC